MGPSLLWPDISSVWPEISLVCLEMSLVWPEITVGLISRPDKSIHRCVRKHSHLYSYIYGLVALLDNIQSSFSSIAISTGYELGANCKNTLFISYT